MSGDKIMHKCSGNGGSVVLIDGRDGVVHRWSGGAVVTVHAKDMRTTSAPYEDALMSPVVCKGVRTAAEVSVGKLMAGGTAVRTVIMVAA